MPWRWSGYSSPQIHGIYQWKTVGNSTHPLNSPTSRPSSWHSFHSCAIACASAAVKRCLGSQKSHSKRFWCEILKWLKRVEIVWNIKPWPETPKIFTPKSAPFFKSAQLPLLEQQRVIFGVEHIVRQHTAADPICETGLCRFSLLEGHRPTLCSATVLTADLGRQVGWVTTWLLHVMWN